MRTNEREVHMRDARRPWRLGVGAALAAGSVGLGLGCAGSETGNGGSANRVKRPVSVEMRLEAPSDVLSSPDRDGFDVVIESARVHVERLDFVLPSGEDCHGLPTVATAYAASCGEDEDRVQIDGPWTVDLVTGELSPTLEGIEVLDGVFERIEMRLRPGEAGVGAVEEGDVLDGASIDVAGTVATPRGSAPYGLTLDLNAVGRFGGGAALLIDESSGVVMLSFDVSEWFADLRLGACIEAGFVPSEGGLLRLERADRHACGDVERALRQAITESGKVGIKPRELPAQATVPAR